jgi:release factor glutamine methyltransferase
VDVVVTNPPYIAEGEVLPGEVVDWEPRGALIAGPTGLEAIGAIVSDATSWLRTPGALVVEIGETQAAAALTIARNAGYADSAVRCDAAGRDRVLVARRG